MAEGGDNPSFESSYFSGFTVIESAALISTACDYDPDPFLPAAWLSALSALPPSSWKPPRPVLLPVGPTCFGQEKALRPPSQPEIPLCINDAVPGAVLELILERLEGQGDWTAASFTCKKWHEVALSTARKLYSRNTGAANVLPKLQLVQEVTSISSQDVLAQVLQKLPSHRSICLRLSGSEVSLPCTSPPLHTLSVSQSTLCRIVDIFCRAGQTIETLQLADIDWHASHTFTETLINKVKGLRSLTVQKPCGTSRPPDTWEELEDHWGLECKGSLQLQKLTLKDCSSCSWSTSLLKLAKCSNRLESLRLVNTALRGWVVQSFAALWRTLTRLELSACSGIDDNVLAALVAASGHSLKDLTLGGCWFSSAGLSSVAEFCISLKSLRLLKAPSVTGTSLLLIAKHRPGLESLHLEQCHNLNGRSLVEACSMLYGIQSLAVLHCEELWNADWIKYLLSCCGWSLRTLIFEGVVDHGNLVLEEGLCPKLETLHLSTSIRGWRGTKGLAVHFAPPVTTAITALSMPVQSLPIRMLKLHGCTFLRDNELATAAMSCPKLELLDISGCSRITSVGLGCIARGSQYLKEIIADNCTRVHNQGVAELAKYRGGSLESLSLVGCRSVSDGALRALASRPSRLEKLSISRCCSITDTGLLELSSGCGRLMSVNVQGCKKVTAKGVVSLVQRSKLLALVLLDKCLVDNNVQSQAESMGVRLVAT